MSADHSTNCIIAIGKSYGQDLKTQNVCLQMAPLWHLHLLPEVVGYKPSTLESGVNYSTNCTAIGKHFGLYQSTKNVCKKDHFLPISSVLSDTRGRIFSRVRPFYERVMSNLDMSTHISLWVLVAHSSFIEGAHMTKNTASGFEPSNLGSEVAGSTS